MQILQKFSNLQWITIKGYNLKQYNIIEYNKSWIISIF